MNILKESVNRRTSNGQKRKGTKKDEMKSNEQRTNQKGKEWATGSSYQPEVNSGTPES
jgi:hypothetical protein